MKNIMLSTAILASAILATPDAASATPAQALTCSAIGNNYALSPGRRMTVNLVNADILTVTHANEVHREGRVLITGSPGKTNIRNNDSQSFTASGDTTVHVASKKRKGTLGIAHLSCISGGSTVNSLISGTSQLAAMSKGVSNNAAARLGNGAQNSFLPTNMFVASGNATGQNSKFSVWASGEYRKLDSATASGRSSEFVLGADAQVSSNAILGFTVGVENMDFGGTRVRSVAYGPYFATRFANGMMLDALITKAKPEYSGTATATGERTSVAFNLAGGTIDLPDASVIPYVNLSGFNEDIDTGTTIKQRRAIVGARVDYKTDASFTPFTRIAIDHKSTSDSVLGDDNSTSPLIGLGVSGQMGNGFLSTEIGYSKYNSTTRELTAQFRFDLNF